MFYFGYFSCDIATLARRYHCQSQRNSLSINALFCHLILVVVWIEAFFCFNFLTYVIKRSAFKGSSFSICIFISGISQVGNML